MLRRTRSPRARETDGHPPRVATGFARNWRTGIGTPPISRGGWASVPAASASGAAGGTRPARPPACAWPRCVCRTGPRAGPGRAPRGAASAGGCQGPPHCAFPARRDVADPDRGAGGHAHRLGRPPRLHAHPGGELRQRGWQGEGMRALGGGEAWPTQPLALVAAWGPATAPAWSPRGGARPGPAGGGRGSCRTGTLRGECSRCGRRRCPGRSGA